MVDLEKLSLEELTELEKNVRAAIASFEKRKRNEAMAAVEAVARKHGYALAELVTGEKPTSARKPPLPPKYRHPDDPARTWSGRGRQPDWVKESIAEGKTLEDLLIP